MGLQQCQPVGYVGAGILLVSGIAVVCDKKGGRPPTKGPDAHVSNICLAATTAAKPSTGVSSLGHSMFGVTE